MWDEAIRKISKSVKEILTRMRIVDEFTLLADDGMPGASLGLAGHHHREWRDKVTGLAMEKNAVIFQPVGQCKLPLVIVDVDEMGNVIELQIEDAGDDGANAVTRNLFRVSTNVALEVTLHLVSPTRMVARLSRHLWRRAMNLTTSSGSVE